MNSREKQAIKLIHREVQKYFKLLIDSCEKSAKEFNSKSVPIELLKTNRNILLRGSLEGSKAYTKEEINQIMKRYEKL